MNNIFYVTNDKDHVLDKDRFVEELKKEDDYIYDFFNSEMPYEVERILSLNFKGGLSLFFLLLFCFEWCTISLRYSSLLKSDLRVAIIIIILETNYKACLFL